MEEESLKIRKIQGYFNTMLFRDLIEHYGLANPDLVRYIIKRMLLNISKPTSVNAIYNDIRSQGRKIDKNRLYDIVEMVCETFLFFKVNRWSRSLIQETGRLPKYYFIDNGMRNAVMLPQSNDDGKLLENAVFLHLRRGLSPVQKLSYFNEENECDFVVQTHERIDRLIQVCWSIADDDTREREMRGLKTAADATGCSECIIVTFDEEDTIDYKGLNVAVVPVWKFLINV